MPGYDSDIMNDDYDPIMEREPRLLCDIPHTDDVNDLMFSDQENIVTASSAGNVTLFKHNRKSQTITQVSEWHRVHHTPGNGSSPCTCVAGQGDDLVVSAGEDGRVNVINLSHRKPIRTIEKADSCTINACEFLKQLEILTVNSSGQLKTFDLRQDSDEPTKTFSVTGEQTPLHCVSKHPSQQHIVATGGHDGVLCIWDLRQDSYPVTLLEAHSSIMWEVKFHPTNPDHLFTCSEDGSVWHWDGSSISNLGLSRYNIGGTGGGSLMTSHSMAPPPASTTASSIWLSMEAERNKMDITSLLPNQSLPVNTIDINANTLLCGTDEEAIYTVELSTIT